MKYELIKEYPGSPELGTIEFNDYKISEKYVRHSADWKGTYFYNAHPKFWKKVEEVDYKILEIQGKYGAVSTFIESLDSDLIDKTIFKVKRLADVEVFTVGDNTNNGTILKFAISNNQIRVFFKEKTINYHVNLNHIIYKSKTPLFTSEDGKEIFEGDKYYVVYADFSLFGYNAIENKIAVGNKFSSCKKAEKFKLLNYPVLCLNDLLSVWGNVERPEKSPLFKKFEKLAKTKP